MKRLSHRDELGAILVDVSLVDLISHDHNAVVVAELADVLQVFLFHHLASGVARVDDYDGTGGDALGFRLENHLLKALLVKTPAFFLLEVVGEQLSLVEGKESRVEWVLGNRAQDTIV